LACSSGGICEPEEAAGACCLEATIWLMLAMTEETTSFYTERLSELEQNTD
jgi:hypothetical protein